MQILLNFFKLAHQWLFTDGSLNDLIGNANLLAQSAAIAFTSDRYGNANSALDLNGAYLTAPAGVYFNTPQISVTFWVYPRSQVNSAARVFDFGSGSAADNIMIFIYYAYSSQPGFRLYSGSAILLTVISSQSLVQNEWQFVAVTFDGATANIYLNGTLTGTTTISSYTLANIVRTSNLVGKGNWNDGLSYSYLDDISFFNASLTQEQVNLEMLKSTTSTTTTTTTTTSTTVYIENYLIHQWTFANTYNDIYGLNLQQLDGSTSFTLGIIRVIIFFF